MSARDDLTVYWGVSGGSTHAAFHNHYLGKPGFNGSAPSPTHLMVNWRTRNNQVWSGPKWMIDSGGAPDTIINNRGHAGTIDEYLNYVQNPPGKYGDDGRDVDVQQFSLRDWPCEPAVRDALDLTVEELQQRTIVDHINMMNRIDDMRLDADPVAILQGWSTESYLEAIDKYRDHGLITDKMAIGTLCGRSQTQVIRTVAWRVARNLPSRVDLHGFGVKLSALEEPDILRIFDSLDTLAWHIPLRQATKDGVRTAPPGMEYQDWRTWDDRDPPNPRNTADNAWQAYRAYAERVRDVEPVETPHDVQVVTLNNLFRLTGDERPEGQRPDEYVVAECPCGNIIDPGKPDPLETHGHRCRKCERAEIAIFDRRIAAEDRLRSKSF